MIQTIEIFLEKEFIRVNNDIATKHNFSEYFYIRLQKDELNYEDKIKYGKNIFDNFFSTQERISLINQSLKRLSDRDSLFLQITSEYQEIHNIPFELINMNGLPGGYLLKKGNVNICRSIPSAGKQIEKIKLPVKILVLISIPLEIYKRAPIDPLKELKNIYNALSGYIDRGLVEIYIEEKVNIPVLKTRLLGKHFDIIHFTGHGNKGGNLLIEDEENTDNGKFINANILSELFAGAGVKLFFFNACESAGGSELSPSISYRLYKSLPNSYILANIASVKDNDATETTKFVYETLLKCGAAGNVLFKSRLMLADDWWKPVFFGMPDIILEQEINTELKKTAVIRIIKRPAEIIDNYVYRYGIVRRTSDLIANKKYLVLHGIAGAGKSTFAAYISQFFDAQFRHHLVFDLKDEGINTPAKLLTDLLIQIRMANLIDRDEFKRLNDEIAADNTKPNVIAITGQILNFLEGKKLIVLDNLEDTAQDRNGIFKEDWKWFIEELLKHKDIFPVFASGLKPYLNDRKPLENILEIEEYTDAEVAFFYNRLTEEKKSYLNEQYQNIKDTAGNHPLFLSKAVEKRFNDVSKVLNLKEFKDYFEFYRGYFDESKEDTGKLFLLKLPFSAEFAENIFSIEFWDLIKNKLLIIKNIEGTDFYTIYQALHSYFEEEYKIERGDLKLFGNKLLELYNKGSIPVLDVFSILNILIDYYKNSQEKTLEQPISEIFNRIDFSGYPDFTYFIVVKFSEIIELFSIDKTGTATSYNNLGKAYYSKGDYDKAIEYYKKSLEIFESKLGKDHPSTAGSYNNIGGSYYSKGDYDQAIEYYMKSLEINESKLGKDHPDTAVSYNNIGGAYYSKGDYDKAIEYYGKSLEIIESKLGKDHPSTATSYNNLGMAYKSKGDYDKAIEYYGKSLEIRESKLGKDHPSTATSYNSIGGAYDSKGDYDKAIEYYGKSLEIYESKLGKGHPDTATSYNNLGKAYNSKGDYDQAIEYYMKSLEIYESKLGKDHPDTAVSYNNIGGSYYSKGDYDQAIEYYMKSLEINESKLGKDHPDTAASYNNLGVVYDSKGDYDKAIEYYMKSLKIRESKLGKDHPDMAGSYNNLGMAYDSKGDYDQAIEYYMKSLEIIESKLGKSHPYTATIYNNLGMAYYSKGDYDRAIEYCQKNLEINESKLGIDHPDMAMSYNNLGLAYKSKDDYDKAIEYYGKSLEINESKLGKGHPYTATSYNNLGLAYQAKGDYNKAIEYLLMFLASEKNQPEANNNSSTIGNVIWTLAYVIDSSVKGKLTGQKHFVGTFLEFIQLWEESSNEEDSEFLNNIRKYFIQQKTFTESSVREIETVLQNKEDINRFREFLKELNE